jgi:hypothetical protein
VTILNRIVVMAQGGAEEAVQAAREVCGVGDDTAFKVIPFGDELMYGYFGYSDDEVRV